MATLLIGAGIPSAAGAQDGDGADAGVPACKLVRDGASVVLDWQAQTGKVVVRRDGSWIASPAELSYRDETPAAAGAHAYELRVWSAGGFQDIACGQSDVGSPIEVCSVSLDGDDLQVSISDDVPDGVRVYVRANTYIGTLVSGESKQVEVYAFTANAVTYIRARIWTRGEFAEYVCGTLVRTDEGIVQVPIPQLHDCDILGVAVQTPLSQSECDALVALHDQAEGENWSFASQWNTPTDPCTWSRVRCGLEGLIILNLRNITFDGPLPEAIGDLTHLTHLDISYSNFTSLPASIGNLSELQMLGARQAKLTSLPPEIGQLTKLESLSLDNNQLTTLPPEIGQLESLVSLYAEYNNLSTLPPEIGNLGSLTRLDLDHNELTVLPSTIGNLASLEVLSVNYNEITELPASFNQLSSLEDLYLRDNVLTDVGVVVELTSLTFLDLRRNSLDEIPEDIGALSNLRWLSLSRNDITSIPASLGSLSSLEYLDLSVNHIGELPVSMEALQLRRLLLFSNSLSGDLSRPMVRLIENRIGEDFRLGSHHGSSCIVIDDADAAAAMTVMDPSWDSC